MKRFFQCFENSGFTVHEAVFPVIFGCVEEEVLSLPEGWPDCELLLYGADDFKIMVGDKNDVFSTEGDVICWEDYLSNISSFFNLNLSNNFASFEIILEYGFLGGDYEFWLSTAAKESKDLHFVGESEDLFFIVSCYFLKMDLGRRYEDGYLLFGDKATVESVKLSSNVGEIEVGLFLFYHEHFQVFLVSFDHEKSWVEFVDT